MDSSSHSIILASSLALPCTLGPSVWAADIPCLIKPSAEVAFGSPVDGVIAILLVE